MLYSHVTLLMLRVVDVVAKTTVQQSARMLVADLPGDIQIGALFPMHRQIAGSEGCGAIWEQYGIQRAEIAMLTVQELNKHLPFRLGISIRDSCWTERIAMEQTIAFLREGVTQCSCCQTAGCQKKTRPTVAIVGPAKSSTTIAVQNLLQVFRIPQIGYGATTADLSDKEQFGYHMRVVPSDAWQARAINQLLRHFNWTYIGVVYSAGNYGEKGFEELERLTHSPDMDVCIAHAQKVKSLASDAEFEEILHTLLALRPRPQVVVCFCEGLSMKKIFIAQRNLRVRNPNMRTFQWIGSDGWADRLDVVEQVEEDATGSFSIRIHSPKVESFERYYFSLNPINNTKNPWFREFWQQKFKCQLTVPKDDTVTPVCTGKENLTMNYEQDPKLTHVINSIRVVGFALKAMYNDKCGRRQNYYSIEGGETAAQKKSALSSSLLDEEEEAAEDEEEEPILSHSRMGGLANTVLCPEMENINGTLLYRYMINVTFVDQFQQEISFDANGDPPPWYDILNYAGPLDGFQLAGDFRQTRGGAHILRMSKRPKIFYDKSSVLPESVCSKPCTVGQRQRKTTECCWICETCQDVQIVNYTTNKCQNCPLGFWPAQNRTNCFPLPHEYHSLASASSLIAFIFALLGIICTALTIFVFISYSRTPVVKSTTRELSFIILSGICACYACTFVILARPSFGMCFASRTLPPIAFSIVYSALLTKTNRIARILAGSKKRILTKKPRFLSTFSQVVITWVLVGIQCVIVAVGVMEEMPQAGFEPHFMPRRMVLICPSSSLAFMAPFVWNFLLILFCTLYAFKTRNLPENFNEAKFIGFTMYCTLVVWGAFVVLYFNAVNKALTMSFTFSLSASIALVLLFFPKIFIIVLHPEKNVRSSYTTTKLIRCHFGNSQGMGDSKHLSSRTRTSLQSSTSMSYPTRTASLHVLNQSANSDPRDSPSAVTMAAGGPTDSEGIGGGIHHRNSQRSATHHHYAYHSGNGGGVTPHYSLRSSGGGAGRREVGVQANLNDENISAEPPLHLGPVFSTSSGLRGKHLHQHQHHPYSPHRQETAESATSRFMRTFSVMGGSGAVGPSMPRGGHYHHHHHPKTSVAGTLGSGSTSSVASGSAGTPSRRKTLDDDVLQLIDSCRRYQDERLNAAQIQNLLLEGEILEADEEESSERLRMRLQGASEHPQVSELLAGSIERSMRTVFSTVQRTSIASSTTPKNSSASSIEPPRLICVPNLIKTSQSPDLINLTPFASEHHHQSHQHIHQQPSNQRRPSTDRNKSDHSSSPPAQPRQVDESGRRSTSSDDGDLSAAKAVPEAPTALVEKEDGEMGNRRLSSAVHVAPAQHQFSASPTAVFQASRIDAIDEEKSGEAPNGRQLVEDDIFEVGLDYHTVAAVKHKRRTLKNRGYALNCRVRRVQNKTQLELENRRLRGMVEELQRRLADATQRSGSDDTNAQQQFPMSMCQCAQQQFVK